VPSSWCHGAVAAEPDSARTIVELHLDSESTFFIILHLSSSRVSELTRTGMALARAAGNNGRTHQDGFILAISLCSRDCEGSLESRTGSCGSSLDFPADFVFSYGCYVKILHVLGTHCPVPPQAGHQDTLYRGIGKKVLLLFGLYYRRRHDFERLLICQKPHKSQPQSAARTTAAWRHSSNVTAVLVSTG